ncbi:MAG: nucleotidyltransferase domain-containing protein [Magnetospirillum sp.]|nr:nucleotidyltransferase domain-containing protein [Magnetospirillum sp.]
MTGLSPREIEIVRFALAEAFGPELKVWLFGSRARGDCRGDVDLYVETPTPKGLPTRLAARRRLETALHRKVDLIVCAEGEPHAAIDAIAKETGLPL